MASHNQADATLANVRFLPRADLHSKANESSGLGHEGRLPPAKLNGVIGSESGQRPVSDCRPGLLGQALKRRSIGAADRLLRNRCSIAAKKSRIRLLATSTRRRAGGMSARSFDVTPCSRPPLIRTPRSLDSGRAGRGVDREGALDPRPIKRKIAEPSFRHDVLRARELRGDLSFGEQILDIADDAENDYKQAKNGALIPNKELVLRSKIRIEARQYHMSRLHPQQWGERQTLDIKSDWSLLTVDERERKARELIEMIREIRNPPQGPPPLTYRPGEPEDDDQQQRGIGWEPRMLTGRER